MGRKIILPLRIHVELEELPATDVELPAVNVPAYVTPRPTAPGSQPPASVPPVASSLYLVDLAGRLPTAPENAPVPATALKSSLTVHWLGGDFSRTASDDEARARLEAIARDHIARDWGNGQGGSGIMYHEAIAPSGTVFVLRDYTEVVWHAGSEDGNLHSRAVLVLCGPSTPATPAQLSALRRRFQDFGVRVYGHREWSATQCPGDQLMEVVLSAR